MLRAIRRLFWILVFLLGLALFAGGAVQLASDLIAWRETGTFAFVALGDVWSERAPGSLEWLKATLEGTIWPPLWDPGMVTLLSGPASLIGLFAGALLAMVGRVKTRRPASS